jgi:hypothetical protein
VSVVCNPLDAFYDIHGRKGEAIFFCSVPDITRDETIDMKNNLNKIEHSDMKANKIKLSI